MKQLEDISQNLLLFVHTFIDTNYFDKYLDLREFGSDIQNGLITIDEAKQLQKDMEKEINNLKGYVEKSDKIENDKNKVLKNVKLPYNGIK